MLTTHKTMWGESEIEVSADWAQASSPVWGVPGGRQVADFRHRPERAIRAAVESCATAEGLDIEDADVAAKIQAAVDSAVEVHGDPPADDDSGDCEAVSCRDGIYSRSGAAERECWSEVKIMAETIERIEDLAGWDDFTASYRVTFPPSDVNDAPETKVYMVRE
jgi:hypothetical protein